MKALTVLLLLVSVIKCFGMSKNEIEEFSNFLWRASTLDQNLKDGSHSSDENEEISDHAWEESGKFEGDLILNERQRRLIVEDVAEGLSRNGLQDSSKRWPNNEVIYYIQREHFTGDQVDAIEEGIQDLTRASCIKFRPYKKGDRDAVVIQGSRRGCFSQVGYQGGYQVLNLSARHPVGRGCFRHGTVVHEMLHTLGFYHMQSSPDRDDFIDVKWENIIEPAKHNFRKYNTFSVTDFGVGYDYDSVLHYSRRAFSSNGRPTLVPKQEGAKIGQRVGLSDKDTEKLNKMYCDADSNSNFEQSDDTPKITKKKKAKNQPFLGHGIGYHQGKIVIIKLPQAKTYKLTDTQKLTDSPSYAGFDYFSRAPEAVSPTFTEEHGFGKEITNKPKDQTSHDLKNYEQEFSKDIKHYINEYSTPSTGTAHKDDVKKENDKILENKSDLEITTAKTNGIGTEDTSRLSKSDENADSTNKSKPEESVEYDAIEAFERLNRIVHSHVYPSQTSKPLIGKLDFSEYYNTNFEIERQSYAKKIDELFTRRPITKISEDDDKKEKQTTKPNKSHDKIIDGENTDLDFTLPIYYSTDNRKDDGMDPSYRTNVPFKKLLDKKKELNLKYAIPEDLIKIKDLHTKDDYSSLYDLRTKKLTLGEPHTLLGSPVPLSESWYKIDDVKSANIYSPLSFERNSPEIEKYYKLLEKYKATLPPNTKESLAEYGYFTDPKSLKYLAIKQDYSPLYKPPSSDDTTKPYIIFGETVPLTKEWYKTSELDSIINHKFNDTDNNEEVNKSNVKEVQTKVSHESDDAEIEIDSDEDIKKSLDENRKPTVPEAILFERAKIVRYNNLNDSNEAQYEPNTTAKVPSYDVTERVEEIDEIEKANSEVIEKESSSDTEDYSSFAENMDVRLNNILDSYMKFDDFDITSPYVRHIRSSEEYNESSNHASMLQKKMSVEK